MRVFYWIGLFLLAVAATAAASVYFLGDFQLLKTAPCYDLAKVVNVLGCGGRDPAHRYGGGFSWCEVVLEDGAIVRVPENSAIVGRIICIDERAPI